eukprot:3740513-Amphidinium_carterae.1
MSDWMARHESLTSAIRDVDSTAHVTGIGQYNINMLMDTRPDSLSGPMSLLKHTWPDRLSGPSLDRHHRLVCAKSAKVRIVNQEAKQEK